MMIIDQQGRLFGKLNIIDAAIGAFILLLVPLAYTSWVLFRVPPPKVTSITPSNITAGQSSRIEIRGEHFRPYMKVRLTNSTGHNALAEFFLESPIRGEIQLPALQSEVYDLVLLDEAQILVTVPGGVMVSDPQVVRQSPPVLERIWVCLAVRLSARALCSIRADETLSHVRATHVTAALDAERTRDGGYTWRNQPIKIEEFLTLAFPLFTIRGQITRIENAPVRTRHVD